MKYNVLIHAINGIGLGHIKRTVLIAKELRKNINIGDIIFVSNYKNPFIIYNEGFIFEELEFGIEDTIKDITFKNYENVNFLKINEYINKYKVNIIIHDTYFIKSLIINRKDLMHFLILRKNNLEYLYNIEKYLIQFKKIFIPHIEEEFDSKELKFLKGFNNLNFIGYITDKKNIINYKKNKEILISPGYGGDYENTIYFLKYVNELLTYNIDELKAYKVIFVLGKHYNKIKNNIKFNKNFILVQFIDNLDSYLENIEIFLGRSGYNSVNEVINNSCKAIFFNVERFAENQEARIDFFIDKLNFKNIKKGLYDKEKDTKNLLFLLGNIKNNKNQLNIFNGLEKIYYFFIKEISKKNILVFKHIFLPKSENFIYEELINFKNINPIIFTLKKENIDVFKNNFQIYYNNKFEKLLGYDYPKILNNSLYIGFLKNIIFIIKKYNISIIYTEFLFDAYYIEKIKLINSNVKIISSGRGYDVYSFLKNVNIKFLRNIDNIFVRDEYMYNELLNNYQISKNKLDIIKSVLDFSKYKFKKKDFSQLDILIGGRFTEKKGLLELLKLLNLLKNNKKIGKIALIGDGELKKEILLFIKDYGLNNKIKYYGFLEHKYLVNLLKEYNCFLNYSKIAKNGDSEGIPNLISENILSGNIVFSTNIGGIGEIIKDNLTGFILSGNIYNDYKKVIDILENKNICFNKIVYNANKVVLNIFSYKNTVEKLEKKLILG